VEAVSANPSNTMKYLQLSNQSNSAKDNIHAPPSVMAEGIYSVSHL
jgi:hypothetical protein